MAKPRVFIGASRENQSVAEALQQSLDHDAEVEIWDQGTFGVSQYPLESLEAQLDVADFAIFVFSADDVTMMRGQQKNTVRDNVVFELGLFIGRLSRKRTFIVSPRNANLHLPSDLAGLTPLDYDASRGEGKLRAALGPAATSIRASIKELKQLPRSSRELATQELEKPPEDEMGLPSSFFEPEASWDTNEFAHTYFVAIFTGRDQIGAELDKAFRASSHASTPEDIAMWEARCDWVQIRAGNNRSVKMFRDKVKLYPQNAVLNDYLGQALRHYGNSGEAQTAFERAAVVSIDPVLTSSAVTSALECKATVPHDDLRKYRHILMKSVASDDYLPPEVLGALRLVADRQGLQEVARAIDELRMEAEPDNTTLRFELAHKYSDDKRPELSLHHYLSIPPAERSGTVWNNLGVAYANLKMPGRAVEAYLLASAKGETIADGNLAHKLVTAGFFEEAKRRADEAVKVVGHHENVVGALTAIQTAKGEEQQKEDEALVVALSEQRHLTGVGMLSLASDEAVFAGTWKTSDGPVELREVAEGTWIGRAVREDDVSVGLGLMFSHPSGGKEITDIEYKLVRFGNALEGTVSRVVRGKKSNSLFDFGIGGLERKVVIVTLNGSVLDVRQTGYETTSEAWSRISALDHRSSQAIAEPAPSAIQN